MQTSFPIVWLVFSFVLWCLFFFFNCFIFFWLCWVFVSVWGLSPVAASGGHSSSRCVGLPLSRPLLLWSTGSRHAGSVVVAHGPSRSEACGILPDQGSNPCPLHWQADSQPLHHQGSLYGVFWQTEIFSFEVVKVPQTFHCVFLEIYPCPKFIKIYSPFVS